MAKPASVPAWATSATKTTPSAGQKAAGFLAGAKWAAQHANWLTGLISDWIGYLNDGAFEGASTFDSTLGVTGKITGGAGIEYAGDLLYTTPRQQNLHWSEMEFDGASLIKTGQRVLLATIGTRKAVIPIKPQDVGDTLDSYGIYIELAAGTTITSQIKYSDAGGTATDVASTSATNTLSGVQQLSNGTDVLIPAATNRSYWIEVTADSTFYVYGAKLFFKRPA